MISLRICGWVVWEFAVLAFATRLARRVTDPDSSEDGLSACFLTWTLILDILATATIATVVTVARANSPWTYLGVAAAILALLARHPARCATT